MDFELKFKKENELLCPRCNSVLKNLGVDYQKHGPWFKCSSCGKFFDEPLATYSCGDCGSIFELQQAVFYSLYSYTLNMNYIGEYEKVTISLKRLETRLAGSGWILKTPAFILGVSGLIHQFSAALWLKKEGLGVILPVDPDIIIEVYASSTAITAERVLSFAVKAQDIDCRIKLLVGIPRFESKAVELAEHYNVELLPVREREMFVETVANYILSRKVSERLQLQTVETAALENALKMLDEKLIGQGG
jgi:DNA-directed RNA polymerase subunit RPC12/RpoP